MKKLTFFFLLLCSLLAIWNCGTKKEGGDTANDSSNLAMARKPDPPMKVVSIADLILLAKIRGADPKKHDPELLREISLLHQLDGELRAEIISVNKATGNLMTSSLFDYTPPGGRWVAYADPGCCACGTNCCTSCGDTTMHLSGAVAQAIQSVSLGPEPKGAPLQQMEDVKGIKVFSLKTATRGSYWLTINTTLSPKPISVKLEAKGKRFEIAQFPNP